MLLALISVKFVKSVATRSSTKNLWELKTLVIIMVYPRCRKKGFNSLLYSATVGQIMFLSRRRVVLIAVIAAVVVTIILLPLILTITLPANLNTVSIALSKVEVVNVTGNSLINLNVFFSIHNPTANALTTSGIEYQLFANDTLLGQGSLSYADVPVNGRPQLLSNTVTTIQSQFQVVNSSNSQIFKVVQNPATLKHIKWKVEGVGELESGFSSSSKQFSAVL
jgi:LEA14-like dessication related protein